MGRFLAGVVIGGLCSYIAHRKYVDLADGAIKGTARVKEELDKMDLDMGFKRPDEAAKPA